MRNSASGNSNSLKTFFVYGGVVLFFILISLLIKTIFVIQASKFDGKHQFVLAIYQSDKLKEIIKFNPSASEISVLQMEGESLEVIPDAMVNSTADLPLGTDVAQTMKTIGFRYNSLATNLTVFDILRLIVIAYKEPVQSVNKNVSDNFFTDETISSENVSIQIVNASDVSGMGKRLENIFDNLGCNIVAVTTSRREEKFSKIQYFGRKTYTLEKLEKILDFSVEKIDKEGIADIVVIIGQDASAGNLKFLF
jgi:hypothetical protein